MKNCRLTSIKEFPHLRAQLRVREGSAVDADVGRVTNGHGGIVPFSSYAVGNAWRITGNDRRPEPLWSTVADARVQWGEAPRNRALLPMIWLVGESEVSGRSFGLNSGEISHGVVEFLWFVHTALG